MIVVADTSPINYLLLIGYVELLANLYGTVLIPEQVYDELLHPEAPEVVRQWIEAKPVWLVVQPVLMPDTLSAIPGVHKGEMAAIVLCRNTSATLLLVDDKPARAYARAEGIEVTGLLGVLVRGAERNLVDLPAALSRSKTTSFRVSDRILQDLLDDYARRT